MPHPPRIRERLDAELALQLKKGRPQRAAAVLAEIVEKDRDDDRLFVRLAELRQKLGDDAGARAAWQGAADAAERKGFYLRAMAALRQQARSLPPHERPWLELSRLAIRLGLVADAIGFLDEGVRAWEAAGDRPRALDALRRGHQLSQDDVRRTLRLAHELKGASLLDEAAALLRDQAARHRAEGREDAWLSLGRDLALIAPSAELNRALAEALLARGEPRGALKLLRPYMEGPKRDPRAVALAERALAELPKPVRPPRPEAPPVLVATPVPGTMAAVAPPVLARAPTPAPMRAAPAEPVLVPDPANPGEFLVVTPGQAAPTAAPVLPPLEPIEITGSAILPAAPVRMDPVELTGSHFLAVTGELPILEAAPAAATSSAPSPRPSPPAGEREVDARPAPATPAPATIPASTSIPTSIPIPIAIPAPAPTPAPAPISAPIPVPISIPAPAPVPIAARIPPPAPLPTLTPVPFTPASMAEAEEEELVDLAADGVTVEDDAPPAPTPEELEHEHEVVDLATAALSVEDEEVIPPEAVEDELAHAAFLVANGFEDEARELLEALAAHHPGHDGVEALRRRLADGRSRVAPRAAPASALDGLFDPLDLPAPEPEPLTAEQVLAGIREGVAAAVPTGDWATRLDLALAYREMGLWSDAVGEYETALLGAPPERAAECLMGMAQCHAGQGRWADAAGLLERVLGIATLAPEASAAASYDLAVVRRSRGDVAGSARAFEAAERALPGFRDAGHQADRMRAEAGGAGGAGLLPDPSGA